MNPILNIVRAINLRIVKLEPRVRAFVVFIAIFVPLYPVVVQVYGLIWGIVWTAWIAAFVLYFGFRAGYFSRRISLHLAGERTSYPEKIRTIQGGIRFKNWDEVEYLEADAIEDVINPDDRVIGLQIDGDAIAYPLSAMAVREVANEEFGNLPVSVTWSPITYSARAFVSIGPNGESFTLAPTDKLVLNSTLLEAEDESHYLQFTGQAIIGPDAGHQLERIPCLNTTWAAWSSVWANSELLSPSSTPEVDIFENYYASTRPGLFSQRTNDKRLPDKDVVLGVSHPQEIQATRMYSAHLMQQQPVINDSIGNEPILLVCERSSATYVAFSRVVDDQVLTFAGESKNPYRPNRVVERNQRDELNQRASPHSEYEPWILRDEQTSSLWHAVSGQCIDGEMQGTRLDPLDGQLGFWFAWSKFYGDVELIY